MRYLLATLIILALVLTQRSLLPYLFVNIGVPHLVLIFTLTHHFIHSSRTVVYEAFLGGLLLDLTGIEIIGLSSFLLLAVLLVTDVFIQQLRFNQMQMTAYVFLASFGLRMIVSLPELPWTLIISGSFFDTLIFMLLFPVVSGLYRVVMGKPVREMRI